MRLAAILLAIALGGAQDVVRTADVHLRGLSPSDFPRVTPLATNVYSFEQIDPTKRTVTVNNLIVVTSAGVRSLANQPSRS